MQAPRPSCLPIVLPAVKCDLGPRGLGLSSISLGWTSHASSLPYCFTKLWNVAWLWADILTPEHLMQGYCFTRLAYIAPRLIDYNWLIDFNTGWVNNLGVSCTASDTEKNVWMFSEKTKISKKYIEFLKNVLVDLEDQDCLYIVTCQWGGVSNKPPGLQAAPRNGARDSLVRSQVD